MQYVMFGLAAFFLPLLYVLGLMDERKVRHDWERLLREGKPHDEPRR